MWGPLVVLAGLAVVGGAINLPFNHDVAFLENWLEPVLGENLHHFETEGTGKLVLALVALAIAGVGIAAGWRAWRRTERPELEPALFRHAWGIDDLYRAFIEAPGRALASFSADVVDRRVVDGAVNGVAVVVRQGGSQLRRLQTGFVRNYALGVAAGTALLLGWFLIRAGT
jgi:NADH-quinone oxidoreductase subunit L